MSVYPVIKRCGDEEFAVYKGGELVGKGSLARCKDYCVRWAKVHALKQAVAAKAAEPVATKGAEPVAAKVAPKAKTARKAAKAAKKAARAA